MRPTWAGYQAIPTYPGAIKNDRERGEVQYPVLLFVATADRILKEYLGMKFGFLPILLMGLPLASWADECNGAPPYDCAAVTLIQQGRLSRLRPACWRN